MRLHWDVGSAPRALVVGFVMLLPLSACGDEEGSASDAGAGGDDAAIDAGGQQDTGVAAHV